MQFSTCMILFLAHACQGIIYSSIGAANIGENSIRVADKDQRMSDGFPTMRWKRSIAKALGTAAVTALLQGAKKAKTDTHDFSKYVKRGNLDTAWRDFKSVNPTDIRKKRVGGGNSVYEGHIGDKTITLSTGDGTYRRIPQITIYDNNSGRIHVPMRIFYKRTIDEYFYNR